MPIEPQVSGCPILRFFFAKGGIRRTPTKPTLPWRRSKQLALPYPLSSREFVTLLVTQKIVAENKELRYFQGREKSKKSQPPSAAEGSAVLSTSIRSQRKN